MDMDELNYLLENAKLQDSLLQAYRQITLTLQGIMFAVGVFLLSQVAKADNIFLYSTLSAIFLIVFCFSIFCASKFKRVIDARGEDINFWHKQIILKENSLPREKRLFSQFKLFQKQARADADYLNELVSLDRQLTSAEANRIIGGGLGHTRKVIDRYTTYGIIAMWVVMLVIVAYLGYVLSHSGA